MWYSQVRLPHWSTTALRRCAVHSITPPHGSCGVGVTGPVVSMLKPPMARADACGGASRAHAMRAAKTNETTDERIILDLLLSGISRGERPVIKKVLASLISEPPARKKRGEPEGLPGDDPMARADR